MNRRALFVVLLICSVSFGGENLAAQQDKSADGVWTVLREFPAEVQARDAWVRPLRYAAVRLDAAALADALEQAPLEFTPRALEAPAMIALPLPDGSFARFTLTLSPVMESELAAEFPEIQTYAGQGIDDPAATLRLDWTPQGFHAQILSPAGRVLIDPWSRGDIVHYSSYYSRDYVNAEKQFACLVENGLDSGAAAAAAPSPLMFGDTRRVYRLAVAATGEYTQFHGGTVPAAMAAIATTINRVNQIYERDASIFMVLVANNGSVIFTDPNTDPFSNNDTNALIIQSQAQIDALIGSANYDVGHTVSTGAGGLAGLGVVCLNGQKARGVTGISQPIGDAFDIDFVAHEIGHQFGGNHPFNGVNGSCAGGNRNAATAFEPGSGSTIMAYAGICGADDLQPHSDAMFHHHSLAEFIAHVTGAGNCGANSATGNGIPTINAGPDYTIPSHTPFALTPASFSDPNGNPLTFSWEQRDLGPAQPVSAPDNGFSPLFRCYAPTPDPTRTFPRLAELLNNTAPLGEKLPTTTRALNFRCLVRDNRPGGGAINWDDVLISVVAGAPFRVTSPDAGSTFSGEINVTWDVAGTNAGAVNTPNVNIRLSTNGGLSFPTVLAANTPNDGTESVILPNLSSSAARIKVEGAGNIFFDVSNQNFTLQPSLPVVFSFTGNFTAIEQTGNGNHSPEPGEVLDLTLQVRNSGTQLGTNVNGTLVSNTAGVTVNAASSAFPNLAANNGTGSNLTPFRITLNNSIDCGDALNFTLMMSANQGSNDVPVGLIAGIAPEAFSAGMIAIADVDGNLNGVADPGETLDLTLYVRNNAPAALGGAGNPLSGTLASLTPSVTVLNNSAGFPQLGPGATGGSLTPFRVQIDFTHDCAVPAMLRLELSPDACFNQTDFILPFGFPTPPRTFAYNSITGPDLAVPIPDATQTQNGVALVPLNVSGLSGQIADLNFRIDGETCGTNPVSNQVGLNHSYVRDLELTLISPSGTQVVIVSNVGNDGHNFCRMLLDDDFGFPNIQTQTSGANAPFTGSWAPQNPLSAFDGENPNGSWTLRVEDQASQDTGFVRAFSLEILTTGRLCDPVEADDQRSEIMGHMLGSNPLSGQPLLDADVNMDGDVNAADLIIELND